jgi:hypothetical protein
MAALGYIAGVIAAIAESTRTRRDRKRRETRAREAAILEARNPSVLNHLLADIERAQLLNDIGDGRRGWPFR